VQWTISAYMLTLGSLFIIAGRIGDIFGRRRVLLGGIAVFGIASAACAVAPNLAVLVAFRVIQGVGAAVIFPVGIAALSNEFPDDARAGAMGIAFGIANIGTALGPFVGGGLAQGPGWRWIFWLLVPLCAISLLIAALTVGDSRDDAAPASAGAFAGCGLLALTFVHSWPTYILVFGFTGFGLGVGWTFSSIGTQEAVRPERAGEASGVLLTIIVTAAGVGVAAAASAIAGLHASGTSLHAAIDAVLRTVAALMVAAAGVTMAVRHQLVLRGFAPPLSMKEEWRSREESVSARPESNAAEPDAGRKTSARE
jgi:MFS family permease